MESSRRLIRFHLFNCDNMYKLDPVEALLLKMEDKHKFKISVEKRYFRLQQMTEMYETIIPKLQMDFAIFVVHAHESRFSINEDNAGIGYSRIYRALLQATGGRVLIVIGGDDQYRDEDEEDRAVISRWARRKVASQFAEEYFDGRESFIFSWNRQHREIHEEALLHFFDPSKKGQKFEYQPKPKPVPVPQTEEPWSQRQKFVVEDDREELLSNDEQRQKFRCQQEGASYGPITSVAADYPASTILLETCMRYGEISYQRKDVKKREGKWTPSERDKSDLMGHHGTTRYAEVQFISQGNGEVQIVVVVDASRFTWLRRNRTPVGCLAFLSCLCWFLCCSGKT